MNNSNTCNFSEEEYKSLDGMLTSVWGPSLWHSLHTISFNYPINPTLDQQRQYLLFFKSLRHILPCKYCRENFVKNLKRVPLTMKTMKNRETLSNWLYLLHEEINTMLGKKSNLTYENVRERYEMFRSRCLNEKKNSKRKTKKTKVKEKGCTTPFYGNKSKCVLNIIPKSKKCNSFNIDKSCIIRKKK